MTDEPDRRVYAEKEIGAILQRATELQGKRGEKPTFGLTLAELQELASDSEIDPELVAAAAMELTTGDDPARSTFLGGPVTLTLRRRIEGHVSEETWSRLVSSARRKFERSGQTSKVGATREWSSGSETSGSASLSIREKENHTEVEVFWSETVLPVPFIVLLLPLCIIGLPIIFESLQMDYLPGAAVWMMYSLFMANLSRMLFKRVASKKRRGIAEFADSIVAQAEVEHSRSITRNEDLHAADVRTESVTEGAPHRSILDLDEPSDDSDQVGGRTARRTT